MTQVWTDASDFTDSAISGVQQPRGYRYMDHASVAKYVLYPFGHGLSYNKCTTAFSNDAYTVSAATLKAGGNISVGVVVSCEGWGFPRGRDNPTLVVAENGAAASEARGGTPPRIARSVLLFLSKNTPETTTDGLGTRGVDTDAASSLPARIEWLGDFTKLRSDSDPSASSSLNDAVTTTLLLEADVLSRWVPTKGGVTATSFVDGQYTVQPGKYTLRLTDSDTTATLTITAGGG